MLTYGVVVRVPVPLAHILQDKGGIRHPPINISSHAQEAGDPLTLAQRQKALIGDIGAASDAVFIPAHHPLCCHLLKEDRHGGACLFRHPQRPVDLRRSQTVALFVAIHGQSAKQRPLVGGAECLAIGD